MLLNPDQAATMVGADNVAEFVCGPVIAYSIRREDAFEGYAAVNEELENIYASADSYCSLRDHSFIFPTAQVLERTVLIIKPGYTPEQAQEITQTLDDEGFVVIGKAARVLEAEAAGKIYAGDKSHIEYNTSDVSMVMVVERMSAVDTLQLLLGPADPERAKAVAPTSLRARYGIDLINNGVYSSESNAKARADVEVLFAEPFPLDRTLAIVKPSAHNKLDAIQDTIKQYGFTILASDTVTMSAQAAAELYADKKDEDTFEELCNHMSSGTSAVLVLAKPGAVDTWLKLLPGLCDRFGAGTVDGSADANKAQAQIDRFFPQLSSEQESSMDDVKVYLTKGSAAGDGQASLQGVLLEGLTQLCRVKPRGMEAVTWLADWLLRNNPNKPSVEEPAEVKDKISVAQQIRTSNGGSRLSVLWAVGGPGSGKNDVVSRLAHDSKYEYISAAEILRAARASGSEAGRVIDDHINKGRIVPTHITTKLLQLAMQRAGGTKFLIDDYPYSLDQAFAFEEQVAKVDGLLLFDCPEEVMLDRLRGDGNVFDPAVASRLKAFSEDIAPLTEHYRVFSKLFTVNSAGESAETLASAKKVVDGIKRHIKA